ncbi:AIPR family protein [Microscilla marina]|uniref:Abortive phage infection protein C-terminal domain-containing protein n=1 Tax=Microscilla marina ATCC 23134 TaxID=313606 RepID=A1ZZ08_MICM2|nr:AIPR family protein [Microscilla marina]EAY24388.1 conserved hypothetical protein [Microscilla marina ATCC 23134]
MLTSTFYRLINEELEQILAKHPNDEALHTHRNPEQNKGYAFLVWFLDFYGQQPLYNRYITDGKDDSSCDIIFSNTDSHEQTIFYVVQSKWVSLKVSEEGRLLRKNKPIQEYPKIKKEEFNAVISDFATVASGTRKPGKNESFNKKYEELITHLERNGKAKFIFFTAADYNETIEDNMQAFKQEYAPNITLELIGIDRIRRDYIEFKFKEIVANNPLEYTYSPEDTDIVLDIERYKNGGNPLDDNAYLSTRDMLQFEGRTQAYIFTLKPKTIHTLFKKYKFKLFFKNVRNPLHRSNYNEKIVETLQRRPDTFWYFNNGITAITKRIPDVGKNAQTLTVKGLQVINGAQTVYSVYQAYENANHDQREIMDTDARISFRLIRSSDEDFNLEITRFTNSQNAMEPRDFVANLEEQRRLQNESFKTAVWYEKRRSEFRLEEKKLQELGIRVLPNRFFVESYLAFCLQRPTDAVFNSDKFFIKSVGTVKGLYDDIFNEKTSFENMLAAALMWEQIGDHQASVINSLLSGFYILPEEQNMALYVLAFSRVILKKYLEATYPNKLINIDQFILNNAFTKATHYDIIFNANAYACYRFIGRIYLSNFENVKLHVKQLVKSNTFYEVLVHEEENSSIDLKEFEEAANNLDKMIKLAQSMLPTNKEKDTE